VGGGFTGGGVKGWLYLVCVSWGCFVGFFCWFFLKHVFGLWEPRWFGCSSSKPVIVCVLGGQLVAAQVALEEAPGSVPSDFFPA